MTPAQIAEFRALLRTQAAPPSPRRAAWAFSPRREAVAAAVDLPTPDTFLLEDLSGEAPTALLPLALADPLPSRPPLFGRRVEPEPVEEAPGLHEDRALLLTAPVVLDVARAPTSWSYETPDVEPPRPQAPSSPSGPLSGGAGWSRVKPPSAQRRLLARLEAVFLAEVVGLDARIAAAG